MKFFSFFRRQKGPDGKSPEELFQEKYQNFRKLLQANSDVLDIMTKLEAKLEGDFIFDIQYVRSRTQTLLAKARTIIDALNALSDDQYADLAPIFDNIEAKIKTEIAAELPTDIMPLVLGLGQVDRRVLGQVGGKNANLGELKNRLGLPTPDGFVLTIAAYRLVVEENLLADKVRALLTAINPDDLTDLAAKSAHLQQLFREAEIPVKLRDEVTWHYHQLASRVDSEPLLAVRSSGSFEDQEYSFAGQYLTCLNVPFEHFFDRYREVLASQFSVEALVYLSTKRLAGREPAMSVGVLTMIPASSSGVVFTRDPLNPQPDTLVVEASWGLGVTVVGGGLLPDRFLVAKTPEAQVMSADIHPKARRVVAAAGAGLREEDVHPEDSARPALSEAELATLGRYGRIIEDHFGEPQDIEFTVDEAGRVWLLQARPLTLMTPVGEAKPPPQLTEPLEALLEGGTVACFGAGAGPVYLVRGEEDLVEFPEGAVLVARHTSSRYGAVLHRAAAMLVDVGSATSHLAILAREFKVPALVDTQTATQVLKPGQVVTVDATHLRVYAGQVDALLEARPPKASTVAEMPIYAKLRRVLRWVTPLNLTDPKVGEFAPAGCRTLHDITRFCHQMAVKEMFDLGEKAGMRDFHTFQLKTPIPFNLHIIDLGGGLDAPRRARFVPPEAVTSIPMRALWRGISFPGISWAGPIPIDVKGLYSVVSRSLTAASPQHSDFWTRTLAIVSETYLNFNSRLGYHFATIDALVGETRNDNYITFRFKGGAADEVRRGRRARFLGAVMSRLDFEVEVTGDLIVARLWKYPRPLMEEKLDLIGRLMGCARQRDMVMADDALVEWYVEAFLAGNYSFAGEPGSAGPGPAGNGKPAD